MNITEQKSLMHITMGEISQLLEDYKSDGWIYTSSFSQISKKFLTQFLPVNPYTVDYNTLKDSYLANIGYDENIGFKEKFTINDEEDSFENDFKKYFEEKRTVMIKDAIQNEFEFHKHICNDYLSITREPSEELLKAFEMVRNDIKEIDSRLSDIQEKINIIDSRNQNSEKQEKRPILVYYQNRNNIAKAEIIQFLTSSIYEYSLSNCYDSAFVDDVISNPPYKYRWNPKSYEHKFPSDLENKFGELEVKDFRKLLKAYSDNKPLFYTELERYISKNNIQSEILNLLDKHHLLNKNKDVISEALKIFEDGYKIMFTNAIPTIIEGILHDICLLVGENEDDLITKGLDYKLDKLHDILKQDLSYEYYAFRFRILRNKIAHGGLNKSIVEEVSDLFLLDLFHICNLVFNDKLKINQKRQAIEKISSNPNNIDYTDVIWYLLNDKLVIPEFYALGDSIAEVEKVICSEGFWNFLEEIIDSRNEIAKHGIHKILRIISMNRKPLQNKYSKLFKKAEVTRYNRNFADLYFKELKEERRSYEYSRDFYSNW